MFVRNHYYSKFDLNIAHQALSTNSSYYVYFYSYNSLEYYCRYYSELGLNETREELLRVQHDMESLAPQTPAGEEALVWPTGTVYTSSYCPMISKRAYLLVIFVHS